MNSAEELYIFDGAYQDTNAILCGVDEAGRGPLCGPVAVGAVVLDYTHPIIGINDSKKLSESKRNYLYEQIIANSLAWRVVLISAKDIDRLNIRQAVLEGMRRAVSDLAVEPSMVLVDGNDAPSFACPSTTVIKGDTLSAAIAAASILAKVTRDRVMYELDCKYPQYLLKKHKGYPTKQHYALLNQYGIQDFYRKSYLKKLGIS